MAVARNYSHRSFLDGALKRDMDIIVGLSDWGFIQGPDPCEKTDRLGGREHEDEVVLRLLGYATWKDH